MADAVAMRKMLVKKFGNNCFVYAPYRQMLAVKPLGEVGEATDATGDICRRVTAIKQVLFEYIDIRQ